MTKVTEQLKEAAMRMLHGPRSECPFNPNDRLPCTVDELADAMAKQDLVDRETVEELRRNNQAWQTEVQSMLEVLRDTERELSHWHQWRLSESETYPNSDGDRICRAVINRARAKIQSPHLVTEPNQFKEFTEIVARSACLEQFNGDKCICFACEAKRLLDPLAD